MKTTNLTEAQKALRDSILKQNYNGFGEIKEIDSTYNVYAAGHPICSPPVGWCAPGNYTSGGPANCGSYTTYTWCAS